MYVGTQLFLHIKMHIHINTENAQIQNKLKYYIDILQGFKIFLCRFKNALVLCMKGHLSKSKKKCDIKIYFS